MTVGDTNTQLIRQFLMAVCFVPFSFNAATVQRPKGFRRVLSLMLLVTGTDESSYIVAN
jgi:hypothetical protein